MKVILKAYVKKLGAAGSLLDVSDGYARNYLFPQNLADEATPGKIAAWKEQQARKKAEDAKLKAEAEELAKSLNGKAVRIEAKAGEGGRLFGSITAAQVAELLEQQHDLKLDKRDIKLDDSIRQAGNYNIILKLYPGVSANMTLAVSIKN